MLAILDVIAIADINCCVDLVLQLRALRNGGNLDGCFDCRVDRGVLEEVGRYGRQSVLGSLAHAGALLRVPAQNDVATGSHVFKHLVEQQALGLRARVQPYTCRTAGRSDVVHIRDVGTLADEQTMIATAPIVGVEMVVDIVGRCHLQLSKVLYNRKVHAGCNELGSYLLRYGEQAVETGDGDGKIRIVVGELVTVEHKALDFLLEELHQRIRL